MVAKETHYYPFGFPMAGISSKAANIKENNKKYQQYELNTDLDINLYESFYRSHDPQLGRFWQVDPKPNEFESPYAAMGNNPILYGDLLGDIITGVTEVDAQRFKDQSLTNFSGKKFDRFNSLVKIGSDGKTFDKIDMLDFLGAVSGFSNDELALAAAYFNGINSDNINHVRIIKGDEELGQFGADAMNAEQVTEVDDKGVMSQRAPLASDNGYKLRPSTGGGLSVALSGGNSFNLIIDDPTNVTNDYNSVSTGKPNYASGSANNLFTPKIYNTTAHEVFGHTIGRALNTPGFRDIEAIQMQNVANRVAGINNVYHNGRGHAGVPITGLDQAIVTSIPAQFRWVNNFFKAINGTVY